MHKTYIYTYHSNVYRKSVKIRQKNVNTLIVLIWYYYGTDQYGINLNLSNLFHLGIVNVNVVNNFCGKLRLCN